MNAAAIWTSIGQFFSGSVDPSIPHLVLILAAVAGGAAVGIGIIWESARDGHLWTLPTGLVLVGVIVEAAATVILFDFDEGISRAQQDKIFALETRLAPRILSQQQIVDLAKKLKPFAGTDFDAAFDLYSGEQIAFWRLLRRSLTDAGWNNISWNEGRTTPNWIFGSAASYKASGPAVASAIVPNVEIFLFPEAAKSLGCASSQLISALNALGISAAMAKPGIQVSNMNKNAVHILIGQKE